MRTINLCLNPVLASILTLLSVTAFANQDPETAVDHSMHHPQPVHSPAQHANLLAEPKPAEPGVQHASPTHSGEHDHRKEHGGQVYSQLKLDNKWMRNSDGEGSLQSESELKVGTDENKLYLKVEADNSESRSAEYAVRALYSRNIADFWDVQAGLRYRQENIGIPSVSADTERLDAVVGLHGLAPYFFETNAHLYVGEDDFVGLELETERDLLLTQKLIMQPYAEARLILKDEAVNAKKTGLSHAALGLETRYEISKKIMPYLDVAYEYDKGNEQTAWQAASDSEKGWHYGVGLRMMF